MGPMSSARRTRPAPVATEPYTVEVRGAAHSRRCANCDALLPDGADILVSVALPSLCYCTHACRRHVRPAGERRVSL